jgi:hypothetical protein
LTGARELLFANNKSRSMENDNKSVDLEQSRRLVEEFRDIKEGVMQLLATGVAETLLPAPKDNLRQAILAVARQACAFNPGDTVTLDRLRACYASLASFLPYDQALAAAEMIRACELGDRSYYYALGRGGARHDPRQAD